MCRAFAGALQTYGAPQELLTDNGKVFTGRFGRNDTEVLFDWMCRENGIDHILTAPRSPTTTGKIERFHRTMRTEFLTGLVFDSLEDAQSQLDVWVGSYNRERPHSALQMNTPADRFTSTRWELPVDVSGLTVVSRDGSDWVSRTVAAQEMISVSSQPVTLGKHRAGRQVDVHVLPTSLQIWDGDELLKTVLRTSEGEVRKKKGDHRAKKVA